LACSECGADHLSGWREDAGDYDGVDLPEDDFDYNEFVRREFGKSPKPAGMSAGWWLVALALLVVTIIAWLFGSGR
jgi:hypothetical protein